MFFSSDVLQSLFIHSATYKLTGIDSDIMYLKDSVGFAVMFWYFHNKKRLVEGVILAMVEKELGGKGTLALNL